MTTHDSNEGQTHLTQVYAKETNMTQEEKMQAAFAIHCGNLRKNGKAFHRATNADLLKEIGDDFTAGYQAGVSQSSATIARLEEERDRHDANNKKIIAHLRNQLAAAELSNKQLREDWQEIIDILPLPKLDDAFSANIRGVANNALAQQPSAKALDAYVAAKILESARAEEQER